MTLAPLASLLVSLPAVADLTLIEDGVARSVIQVAPQVMAATPEDGDLHRLARSVEDLAHYLEVMSGAGVDIVPHVLAEEDERIPILIGEVATARFGPVSSNDRAGQGFRVVVTPEAVGLLGESDLATSYAIYELLDQLGCRWYIPSEMGEVIPHSPTVAVPEQDLDSVPYTLYRGIWYADEEYRRRNRLGGLRLNAGHALEQYLGKGVLEENPAWKAVGADGLHHGSRLKWSAPGVAEAIADTIIRRMDADPDRESVSLSPDDGLGFDHTDDLELDAGDWDPAYQGPSITDRLIWFTNRIADRVTTRHPDVLFGLLAYVNFTRPPVREQVHLNIVPQIAPIGYSRAHPMTDDGEPNNAAFRELVTGWAQAADMLSYYFYGWFLAEASAPCPFITKWATNIPIVYEQGRCRLWQPETVPSFETNLHALYMGIRMAWDPSQDPLAIVEELHERFYGSAARQMAAYWHFIDGVWVDTPEYSGGGWGHLRRWTPERLARARDLMDAARQAAQTPQEVFRVRLADESLGLFELFMKLRQDLAEGRFGQLDEEAERYRVRAVALGERYAPQYAFTKLWWTRDDMTMHSLYFRLFYEATYRDAARIARTFDRLTDPPLRRWRYRKDEAGDGETLGWMGEDFDDADWPATDPCVETWSSLGYHNDMGVMWYRTEVELPQVPAGRRVSLWIGATDGTAEVFVNGLSVDHVTATGERRESFSGYAAPASFDVTDAVRAGPNLVAIRCERTYINEVGTGGLLGPAVLYRERD